MYYIGIDLGTSSVKVVAMDAKGDIIGEGTADYPLYFPSPGWAEQNPEDWWQGTVKAIEILLKTTGIEPNKVASIGLSGQMHGLVALDVNGSVILPAMLWCDQRTQNECNDIIEKFHGQGLLEHVANQALTGFTAPKLLWLKKHHFDLFKKIEHILLPKDYIRYKMTGEFATDYSDASGMLLLDVKNKCFSKVMCDYIGIKESSLPKLYESYEVTGHLSKEALQTLGLEGKISVVGGAGDQAAGAIGTGTVKKGIISVTLGTSGVVFAAHDNFVADDKMRLHAFCHANGKYHSMGVMLSAASCIKWWTEVVNSDVPFHKLMEEAEQVPLQSEHVIFLPYLMGERTPYANPDARGTFIGLTPTTTRGELTRAIFEGVAFGLKDSIEILREIQIPMEEIRVIGGGSKNNFWMQILANIFEMQISRVNTDQGGALGAAILAAVGAGEFESVEVACDRIINTTDIFKPRLEEVGHYKQLYLRFKGLYQALEPWF